MKTTKQTLQELLDEVDGERTEDYAEKFPKEWLDCCGEGETTGYNKALDTITTIIKRKIEELTTNNN